MLPPAPGRFSTTTGWPSAGARCAASQRARISTTPAVPPGTMRRTGLVGQGASCASASGGLSAISRALAASRQVSEIIESPRSGEDWRRIQSSLRRRNMEYSRGCMGIKLLVQPTMRPHAMDKFRALQYFLAAATANSFSGAARQLEVSVTAVAKLVGALERALGTRLFERSAHGVVLTASGEGYLDGCQEALAQLQEPNERVSAAGARTRGTVVVGVQHVIAHEALAPALPRFNALYPDIQIDVRNFLRVTDEQMSGVDVCLV